MTTELKCIIGGANCKGSITIAESVAPDATYTCSQCNSKPLQRVFFQDTQFDKELGRGTEFIPEPVNEDEGEVVVVRQNRTQRHFKKIRVD